MSIDALKKEIMNTDPAIIALQECPDGSEWAKKTFPSYQVIGSTYSHADQVVLLVKNGIQAKQVSVGGRRLVGGSRLPAIVAEMKFNNRHLLVASVHLAPFDEGEYKRKMQMKTLLSLSESRSMPLLVMGDMNMRDREDDTMENELGLLDAWKLAGSNVDTRYTWDTVDHRNEISEGTFNQYYGKRTRQYQRRYDRIYVSTATGTVGFAVSPTFDLIANRPMTTEIDFLSDHFGMASQFNLRWKE